MISNIRIVAGAPGMCNVFIAESEIVAYSIYLNVNKSPNNTACSKRWQQYLNFVKSSEDFRRFV